MLLDALSDKTRYSGSSTEVNMSVLSMLELMSRLTGPAGKHNTQERCTLSDTLPVDFFLTETADTEGNVGQ